jgi:hypothetical protein
MSVLARFRIDSTNILMDEPCIRTQSIVHLLLSPVYSHEKSAQP